MGQRQSGLAGAMGIAGVTAGPGSRLAGAVGMRKARPEAGSDDEWMNKAR